MICAIIMIRILLLSVTFVMYFKGRNKDIYLFIIFNNEWMNVKNAHRWIATWSVCFIVCFKREPRNDRKIWILQHYPKDFYPGLYVRAIFWSKVARHTPGFNPFFAPFASSEVFDHILNKSQKSRCQTRHSNTGHKTQKSSISDCRFSWCDLSWLR